MGAVSSIIFAVRNGNKVAHGDTGRVAAAGCQTISSIDSIAKSSIFSNITKGAGNVLTKADGAVDAIFKKIGGESGTKILNNITEATGAGSKLGAVAQKAVNPLLCGAAGIRVLKDDDQYAALIEEVSAMGAMFSAEGIMKAARGSITGEGKALKGMAGLAKKIGSKSETLKNLASKASNWYTKLKGTEGGNTKQFLVRLGIDALFVGGSILAYNLGHKLGEKISNREEKPEQTEQQTDIYETQEI